MKVILFLAVFLSEGVILAQNALLPKELRMESFVRLEQIDTIFRNRWKTYKYSETKQISSLLFEALLSEKNKVYNTTDNREYGLYSPLTDTLSAEDLKSKMGVTVISSSGADEFKYFAPTTYNILGFEESWSFNAKELQFEKQVYSVKIIRESEDMETGEVRTYGVCTIPNNLVPSAKPAFVAEVSFEQPLILPSDWIASEEYSIFSKQMMNAGLLWYSGFSDYNIFTGYSRKQLYEGLCNGVLSGKLKALDFYSRKQLDPTEINKRLGSEIVKVLTIDDNGNEKTTDHLLPPNKEDFNAIIFTEDWYFDETVFSFKKDVKEIALVRYTYSETDSEFSKPLREICFSVVLNHSKTK